MEMTLWMLNGQGSQQFAILGFYLQMMTARTHRFFGDFLDYPQTLPPCILEERRGRQVSRPTWLTYIADVLQRHEVNIRIPRHPGDMDTRIHSAFLRPPDDDFWKGVGDTNSNFRQNRSNSRMVTHITDLFFLTAEETVKVKWVGTHGWSRKIANDVGQQQDDRRRDANTPLVNLAHVKEVLREIQHQFGPIVHSNRNRRLPSYRWQYNAQQAARLLRADFIRRPVETRDFRRSALRETFLTPVHTVGMSRTKEITVYTDGSYINTPELLSMSFAAIISYVDHENNEQEFVAAGRMAEGPFSSTTAELMALALTMALVPKGIPVTISSDSKAAIKLANGLLNKHDVRREYEKSNIAHLAACVRPWFQRHKAATMLKWVKGHSSIAGNERADEACDTAHSNETPWTTCLAPAPDAPQYRLCIATLEVLDLPSTTPPAMQPATLVLATELAIIELSQEHSSAVPWTEDKYKQEHFQADIYVKSLNLAQDRAGHWVSKNSCRITNRADHNCRSYGIKAAYGWLATQDCK
ncbi:hypothetical protein H4S07_000959 [Coemansia furcata]|uniref:Uncharacterized protein n=1 Tax=Coemansia furcata TaxID=417177 RepID=A0ACC1LQM7_9FUNG|nr:hypothetical protein H4S07_000959 [Coemansia furcata]